MARVKRGTTVKARHKKILKLAKGYRGRARTCYSVALQRVEKALAYAYRDRRNRKRDFRSLWIIRINAAVRQHGLTYGRFINGLLRANITLDRKVLAEMAVNHKESFAEVVRLAQNALDATCAAA